MRAIASLTGSRSLPLLSIAARLLPLVALVASPAGAQIFKCTDRSGNVLYQNGVCPKNTTADRVDIFDNTWTADRAEKDAAWQRAAGEHHVVAGMPLRWVREALGEPAEVRKSATAGADQVWLYSFPDRSMQVGVLSDQVLWFRETPVIAPTRAAVDASPAAAVASSGWPEVARASPDVSWHPSADAPHLSADVSRENPVVAPVAEVDASPAAAVAPSGPRGVAGASPEISHPSADASRAPSVAKAAAPQALHAAPEVAHLLPPSATASESSRGVARGQDCRQALAELGKPDRQREVPALDKASDPTTEYFYEPGGGDSPTRLRLVCANGKVEGVDRTVIR